jgi:hypothetical protein
LLAADEERGTYRQIIDAFRWRRSLGQQEGADFAEAHRVVGPKVEVLLVANQAGDRAVAVQDTQQLGFAVVGLLPERIRPLLLNPARVDRVGRENQQDEVGIEPFLDPSDDVLPGRDLPLIEPYLDLAVSPQLVRELTNKNELSLLEWLRKTEITSRSCHFEADFSIFSVLTSAFVSRFGFSWQDEMYY